VTTPTPARAAFADALEARHLADLTTSEFTRAVRALSTRYVEERRQLPARSPLDSAGKRAAFGLFYAQLHLCTVEAFLAERADAPTDLQQVVDLGCGTGVCGAALAMHSSPPATLLGVDGHPWALDEARWNWRALGLTGRAVRGDLARTVRDLAAPGRANVARLGVIAGWAINELPPPARAQVIGGLRTLVDRGATVLVFEPLARAIAPWWDDAVAALGPAVRFAGDWKSEAPLPARLADLSRAAGFSPRVPGARVLYAGQGFSPAEHP
jgi:hypothetical protein